MIFDFGVKYLFSFGGYIFCCPSHNCFWVIKERQEFFFLKKERKKRKRPLFVMVLLEKGSFQRLIFFLFSLCGKRSKKKQLNVWSFCLHKFLTEGEPICQLLIYFPNTWRQEEKDFGRKTGSKNDTIANFSFQDSHILKRYRVALSIRKFREFSRSLDEKFRVWQQTMDAWLSWSTVKVSVNVFQISSWYFRGKKTLFVPFFKHRRRINRIFGWKGFSSLPFGEENWSKNLFLSAKGM